MAIERKSVVTNITSDWIYGENIEVDTITGIEAKVSEWQQLTDKAHRDYFWFLLEPKEVFEKCGLNVSVENAKYLQKIFEETWIDGIYLVAALCRPRKQHAEDIAKLIINDVSAVANDIEKALFEIINIEHFHKLFEMIFDEKSLDKRHFKEIVARLQTEDILDIINDPKYKKADNSVLIQTVSQVISDNRDKIDGSDKIKNWLIGQVMRALKGTANPVEAKTELEKQLGEL